MSNGMSAAVWARIMTSFFICMRNPQFVHDIWISTCDVCDDHSAFFDAFPYIRENVATIEIVGADRLHSELCEHSSHVPCPDSARPLFSEWHQHEALIRFNLGRCGVEICVQSHIRSWRQR